VQHFAAIEAQRGERFERFATSVTPRMRPHGKATGVMNERDRVTRSQHRLRYIRRPAGAKKAVECIAEILHRPHRNHDARNVRTSECAASSFARYVGKGHGNSERIQPRHDGDGTFDTLRAKHFEPHIERRQRVDVETEDVHFTIGMNGRELDARHDANSE
jgi:hypothetical protein